ncbi:DUF3386 domain-containing protein [Leptolyngbya ohadii]|uniref:DUF3386 domain-containing protein n=1 Tax=Leptolyngbya ohadii TaxID=1962290 RepID=UPI000B59A6C4
MTEQTARDLFRAAYENRNTWDSNFPGYTADVTYRQGNDVYQGKVRVNPDRKADVLDVEDEQAKKAIASQMWETAIHRVRYSFETTHKENEFSFGETDETGAVEILVGGKCAGDRYKVRDNIITLVHRHIHGVVVTINTFSVQETSEGYLAHRYDSVYHDPATGEQKGGVSQFEDSFENVDGYYILTGRKITTEANGKTYTDEYSFSNVKLLQPAIV